MNTDYDYVIYKPDLNEDTLAHYGVKGMKWKRHKLRTKMATKSSGTKYNYLDDLYKTDHPSLDLLNSARDDLYKKLYETKPGFRKVYDFMHKPVTDIAKDTAKKIAGIKNNGSLTSIPAYAQSISNGGGHDRSVSTKERPVSRKKNVTEGSKKVKKKGSGLGTGKVGK